jgi:hypothetical protein
MVKNELKKNFTALAANNTLFIIGGGCEENGFNQNFYLKPKPEKSLESIDWINYYHELPTTHEYRKDAIVTIVRDHLIIMFGVGRQSKLYPQKTTKNSDPKPIDYL